MPLVGFEPTILLFELSKTHATTGIWIYNAIKQINTS